MKKYVVAIIFVLILTFSVYHAYAGRIEDAKEGISILSEQLNKLEEIKKTEEQKLDKQVQEKEQILEEMNENVELMKTLEEQAQLAYSAIESIDVAIELTEENYNELLRIYEKRLCVMYKNMYGGNIAITFLESKSIREIIEKLKTIRLIADIDNQMLERLKQARQEIMDLKTLKSDELDSIIQKIKDVKQNADYLEISRGQVSERIQQQMGILHQYGEKEDEYLEASHNLEQQLKILDKGVYVGGKMVWPAPSCRVLNKLNDFGWRLHPVTKTWKIHTGVDIGGNRGDYIVAANDGMVIHAGDRKDGYGNLLIIDHGGGVMTVYAHIDKNGILVVKDQYVKAGQVVAKVGMTGVATCPHLHFEVRKWGKPVDPLGYIPRPRGYF